MIKDDLLKIETDDFILSFLGAKPNLNSFTLNGYTGARQIPGLFNNEIINIVCVAKFGLVTIIKVISYKPEYNRNTTKIDVYTSYQDSGFISYLPLFYEDIDYLVQLSPKRDIDSGKKYFLWHEHSSIRNNLAYFKSNNAFSGFFNFGNNVGLSEFLLKDGEKNVLLIQFEVFSLKINYLEERYHMLSDLSKIKNNLVFRIFKPTKSIGITQNERASGLEWLVSFYNTSEKLIKIIKSIERTAHNRLYTEQIICPLSKVKKRNKSLFKQINRYGKDIVLQDKNVSIEFKISSYNTPENRYIKYLMEKLIVSTKKWITYVEETHNSIYESIKKEHIYLSIIDNIKKIERICNNSFWGKIEGNINSLENKTNFLFHNEFVLFEKSCREINKAISLDVKGSNFIYTLPMESLYEVWTFCKLAQIIGGIVYNDINNNLSPELKVDAFGAILKTGEASKIRVKDDITISTNRLFTTNFNSTYFSPLVNQKPDLVFEIENKRTLNILDAKYKIDIVIEDSRQSRIINNADLVSEDLSGITLVIKHKDSDINTMHRYKDAIQTFINEDGTMKIQKAIKRGIILYPHKPNRIEFERIKNYLDKMDIFKIGPIPLAPGKEDSNWLNNCDNIDELVFDETLEYEQIRILANQVKKMVEQL